MAKRILFIPAGIAQFEIINRAIGLGFYAIAMDGDKTASGLKIAHESYVEDILNIEKIKYVYNKSNADAIVSVSCDSAMHSISKACDELNIPGIKEVNAITSQNKYIQRVCLKNAGLLVPHFEKINNYKEAILFWDNFDLKKMIIKPNDSSGSKGVSLIFDKKNIKKAFSYALNNSRNKKVIVEEFIEGPEFSVEAWETNKKISIIAISEKERTDPPYLLDKKVHFPPLISEKYKDRIKSAAIEAIKACEYRECPIHLECIFTCRGPVVVELSARGAGFKVFSEILPQISGFCTAKASIDNALGKQPEILIKKTGICCSIGFIDPIPGKLFSVNGVEEAKQIKGIKEVIIYKNKGTILKSLQAGCDRVGHVIAIADDPVICRKILDKALKEIKIITQTF